MKEQIISINIDDSGKLVSGQKVAVYAGLVFTNKEEKDKFITQYKKIVSQIKCKYCNDTNSACKNSCPEIKHNMLKPRDNRWMMNYIKKYSILCCVINNDRVYDRIKTDAASRGRYLDFALKLLIKATIKGLIKDTKIDPNLPVKLIINIDEQPTKSNGYYDLKRGIEEELLHGIYNYNYGIQHNPILFNSLEIALQYQKSDKSYLIQASDLIAGTVRRLYLDNSNDAFEFSNKINFCDYVIYLP